jgi:hypothetical protein
VKIILSIKNHLGKNVAFVIDGNFSLAGTYTCAVMDHSSYGNSTWSAPVSVTIDANNTSSIASSTSFDLRTLNLASIYNIIESLKIIMKKLTQIMR